jgi:DNA polymerase (family 10)
MNKEPISKKDIAAILQEIGKLLELKGENPFKSRAYLAAARTIETMESDITSLVEEGTLSSIKGIGTALEKKITELITTGQLEYYENLKASIPPGLLEMIRIQNLGPKKIRALHEKLNITTVGELEYACIENRLVGLPGFGRKTQDNILTGIELLKRYNERHLYSEIIEEAEDLLNIIHNNRYVVNACLAGSIRRLSETVKDIDIVVSTEKPLKLSDFFTALPQVAEITAKGSTKVSVLLESGVQTDLRIVTEQQYPYALHHFTGSKEHNVAMRSRAKKMDIKINEYGLFGGNGLIISCRSEEGIFSTLGLSFINPELRENTGEIEAAGNGQIPELIRESDIRGLLHIHTNASDGSDSLESIVRDAREMGLEYIGISDHSRSAYYAGGLSIDDIKKQHEQIDRINESEPDFFILKGIESDILPDGSLDYDDSILSTFDFVIGAIHSNFGMPMDEMNTRIMKAIENPFLTILAHPTGRLLLAREPYRIDMEKIIDHAAEMGKFIELNANPHRLDLDWRFCRYAKNKKVKIAINPDAHNADGLRHIKFGINIARKGWITSLDCINCLGHEEIKKCLQNRIK